MAFIQSQLSLGSTEIQTLIGEDKETTDFFQENPLRMTEGGTHRAAYDNILRREGHNRARVRDLQKLKIAIAKDKHTITRLRGRHAYTSQAINALAIISLGTAGYGIGSMGAIVPTTTVITDPNILASAATSCMMSHIRFPSPFVNPYSTPINWGCAILNSNASANSGLGRLFASAAKYIFSISGSIAGALANPGDQLVDRHIQYAGSHHRREWLLEVEKEEDTSFNINQGK